MKENLSKREINWNRMYTLAKNYYEHYGNLLVPGLFITKDGYNYYEYGEHLGSWIARQRVAYKNKSISVAERKVALNPLTDEQVDRLLKIRMVFEIDRKAMNNVKWDEMYVLAKAYYEHYGDLLISRSFKTKNGYDYDKFGKNLGSWIARQRVAYKNRNIPKEKRKNSFGTLTDEQVDRLLKIGMIFESAKRDVSNVKWDEMYILAKAYYEHYGNLLISQSFKTKNGYDYDESGERLGSWLARQREAYKNRNIPKDKRKNSLNSLSKEQTDRLLKIGMIFESARQDVDNVKWDEMYILAKAYYEHYGNLLISRSFKTKNGYDYDEFGERLGSWIKRQREAYKNRNIPVTEIYATLRPLTDDQVELLLKIGMIFEVRKNRNDIIELCNIYGLEYEKYEFLHRISYCELSSKINFLLEHNMSIVVDGMPNPIFTTSSINMELIYGISLEKLTSSYFQETKKLFRR